jgi:hypothetical protein
VRTGLSTRATARQLIADRIATLAGWPVPGRYPSPAAIGRVLTLIAEMGPTYDLMHVWLEETRTGRVIRHNRFTVVALDVALEVLTADAVGVEARRILPGLPAGHPNTPKIRELARAYVPATRPDRIAQWANVVFFAHNPGLRPALPASDDVSDLVAQDVRAAAAMGMTVVRL